ECNFYRHFSVSRAGRQPDMARAAISTTIAVQKSTASSWSSRSRERWRDHGRCFPPGICPWWPRSSLPERAQLRCMAIGLCTIARLALEAHERLQDLAIRGMRAIRCLERGDGSLRVAERMLRDAQDVGEARVAGIELRRFSKLRERFLRPLRTHERKSERVM